MSDKVYAVPAQWKKRAYVDDAEYKKMYSESVKSPEKFWAKHAKRIDWFKAPTKIKNTSFAYDNVSIKWFEDGVLNVSVNCIDRHLK
jgi:acetyl-CoA synthetase